MSTFLITYLLSLTLLAITIILAPRLKYLPGLKHYVDDTVVKVITGCLIAYIIVQFIIGPLFVIIGNGSFGRWPL